jgi:hypothetical protein
MGDSSGGWFVLQIMLAMTDLALGALQIRRALRLGRGSGGS